MVWYSHLFQNFPQFIVIHTVKGFGIVNKAEMDAFLELSCFFHDPSDVGNLISDSSAFSKTSLNIWKFMVHVLWKPGLKNFEHYFISMWDECNCAVVWAFICQRMLKERMLWLLLIKWMLQLSSKSQRAMNAIKYFLLDKLFYFLIKGIPDLAGLWKKIIRFIEMWQIFLISFPWHT